MSSPLAVGRPQNQAVTNEYIRWPTQDFGTVGRMDAALERTGMYSQRVQKVCVGQRMHAAGKPLMELNCIIF
jgi:hypothetical protein